MSVGRRGTGRQNCPNAILALMTLPNNFGLGVVLDFDRYQRAAFGGIGVLDLQVKFDALAPPRLRKAADQGLAGARCVEQVGRAAAQLLAWSRIELNADTEYSKRIFSKFTEKLPGVWATAIRGEVHSAAAATTNGTTTFPKHEIWRFIERLLGVWDLR